MLADLEARKPASRANSLDSREQSAMERFPPPSTGEVNKVRQRGREENRATRAADQTVGDGAFFDSHRCLAHNGHTTLLAVQDTDVAVRSVSPPPPPPPPAEEQLCITLCTAEKSPRSLSVLPQGITTKQKREGKKKKV
eukprot:318132-Hanusia_phi.AAC.2